MNLTSVQIENFRGIKRLDLEFGNITVLIGENNTGKTSVLDALKLCLTDLTSQRRTVFDAMDFHLPDEYAEPSSAEPITIRLTFSEPYDKSWSDALKGRLVRAKVLQVDESGNNYVYFQVICKYDYESGDYGQEWSFLDLNGYPLTGTSSVNKLHFLRSELHYYYLSALRDASKHFNAKGPFWRPFLKDSQLSKEKKSEIEDRLKEVNSLIVSSHASFEQVKDHLRELQSLVLLRNKDPISIEAVPNRMFDILSKAEIQVGATTGARIPLARHGEGTQSLAVLMLFFAFLNNQEIGTTILALEEPEAHLHPSAIRTLWKLLQNFTTQQLISTHSGELVAETDIRNIRRLAQTSEGIRAFHVPSDLLTQKEARKFNYQIQRTHGELLFARCWLLVEGETEIWIYEAAAKACDLNLHEAGIRLVEFSQSDIGMLIKIANSLGIAWYCVGDNDRKRHEIEPKLKRALNGAAEEDRFGFPYPNIEKCLLENGCEEVYLKYMPEQNRNKITKKQGEDGYWREFLEHWPKKHKTKAAADIALKFLDGDAQMVPQEIQFVLEKVLSLAEG